MGKRVSTSWKLSRVYTDICAKVLFSYRGKPDRQALPQGCTDSTDTLSLVSWTVGQRCQPGLELVGRASIVRRPSWIGLELDQSGLELVGRASIVRRPSWIGLELDQPGLELVGRASTVREAKLDWLELELAN